MAKEWYLLSTPNDQVSGYESEAFEDFAAEGFLESLSSSLADDIEICNYDLSECKKSRAIILNKTQDTKLKSLTRNILLPIGSCVAGNYIKYDDRYWIVVGFVDNNKIYEKAIVVLCNYLLSWVNREGKIIQRWVSVSSASQYNNGESGMKYYFVRSDQLLIVTPDDEECLLLSTGQRFIIDRRCRVYEGKFDETVTADTSNPVMTYEVTRLDTVLYSYQDSGHSEFMCTQDEQHQTDGYYVIDGKGYWLCDMPRVIVETEKLSSAIECDNELYAGLNTVTYSAKFYDAFGNLADVIPIWKIESNFEQYLTIEYIGNSVTISASEKLANKSFTISLDGEGYETVTKTVTIHSFI